MNDYATFPAQSEHKISIHNGMVIDHNNNNDIKHRVIRLLVIVYSVLLTVALIYPFIQFSNQTFEPYHIKLKEIVVIIIILWIIMIIINIYCIYKLFIFYKQQTNDKIVEKICITFFCFVLSWLLFGIYQIIILSQTNQDQLNPLNFTFFLLQPMAIISTYQFCSLSLEINYIIKHYENQTVFGLSYSLFVFKWYSVWNAFGAFLGLIYTLVAIKIYGICLAIYLPLLICSVILCIQINQIPSLIIKQQRAMNINIECDDKKYNQALQSDLLINDDDDIMANNDNMANSSKSKMKEMMKFGKSKYKKHNYWISNGIIIISCILTIIGALLNFNKAKQDLIPGVKYVTIGQTFSSLIIFVALLCVIMVLWTMCLNYNDNGKALGYIVSDNKLRFICICKTTLLLIKQCLIKILSQSLWDIIFSILSLLSLITLTYITYAVDKVFVERVVNLRVATKKISKRIYRKYLISYSLTNISSFWVVIASILSASHRDKIKHNHNLRIISNLTIFAPFLWLYFGKLYNNEFARFKYDIMNNKKNIKSIPSTIQSLYHFENNMIIACLIVVIGFLYQMIKTSSSDINIFMPLLTMQLIFPCILVLSLLIC